MTSSNCLGAKGQKWPWPKSLFLTFCNPAESSRPNRRKYRLSVIKNIQNPLYDFSILKVMTVCINAYASLYFKLYRYGTISSRQYIYPRLVHLRVTIVNVLRSKYPINSKLKCTSHGGMYSAHCFGKISITSKPWML